MTTYLGQLNNRVEINKRKLASLEEYKDALLNSETQIDKELLADRLTQIDMEFNKLKKAIHANQKAEAHYNAAYNHLIELRVLDSKLQMAKTDEEKDALTQEIIAHTSKLEKHLAILPEKLVEELQQDYIRYTENNPLIIEEEENVADDIPVVAGNLTDDLIYRELLEIFEKEKQEFDEIKVFDTPEELERFINKYNEMKMSCYTRLALFNNIGKEVFEAITDVPHIEKVDEVVENEEPDFVEDSVEVEEQEESSEPKIVEEKQQEIAPIVVMLSLVDGLEIVPTSAKKLTATNVKISNTFKEELKVANWLYNVIHYTTEIAEVPEISHADFMEKVAKTEKNKNRIEIVKDRINNLAQNNLVRVYNEYYGDSNNNRLTTVLKVLITEKVNEIA